MQGIPEFGNDDFEASLGADFKSFVDELPESVITQFDGKVLLLRGTRSVAQLEVSETHDFSEGDKRMLSDHWSAFG